MEEEIKPKIINILDSLIKIKTSKYQKEKLDCMLASKELSVSKKKNFKKIQLILVDNFKNLHLPHVVEELIQSHYKENKKIVSLEGVLEISNG